MKIPSPHASLAHKISNQLATCGGDINDATFWSWINNKNLLGNLWQRNELFEKERWITLPFPLQSQILCEFKQYESKHANVLPIFHVTQQEIHNNIWLIYTIKMLMLKLHRTINKLELATKSSEDFYSHQFMKFHGSIQYKIIRLLGI